MLLHNVFETPTLALVCIMDMTSCSFLMQSCVQGYYDKCDIKIYKTSASLTIWGRQCRFSSTRLYLKKENNDKHCALTTHLSV